jgi:tetratricopeptide (TPR) repeat protein
LKAMVALCMCLILTAALPAAAIPDPFLEAWFLYEQGKAKMEIPGGGEMGEALLLFAQAIDKRGGTFPEAEIALGDIYRAEGAYALAKRQYDKAWDRQAGFEIPEEKYTVLYRLAELAEMQNKYGDMESDLLRVLEEQPSAAGSQHEALQNAMKKTYLEKGLDQTFRLYRLERVSFAATAHSRLGWLFYRTGRFDSGSAGAIMHLLLALDIMVTEMMAELRRADPEYVYSTLEDFLGRAARRENVAQYIRESGFVEDLYYLAAATWAAGEYPSRAAAIWRILASGRLDPALVGDVADRARRQLQSPWVEPYLNTSPRSVEYPKR